MRPSKDRTQMQLPFLERTTTFVVLRSIHLNLQMRSLLLSSQVFRQIVGFVALQCLHLIFEMRLFVTISISLQWITGFVALRSLFTLQYWSQLAHRITIYSQLLFSSILQFLDSSTCQLIKSSIVPFLEPSNPQSLQSSLLRRWDEINLLLTTLPSL
jgi:hypothetical protein